MGRFLCGLLALLVAGSMLAAADWPGWRGPGGQGFSGESKLPVKWSGTENVRWKVKLEGDTLVLDANPRFNVLAVNRIGPEHTDASIAVSDGELFIRTHQNLWCISGR
jgi:hypothetical protein